MRARNEISKTSIVRELLAEQVSRWLVVDPGPPVRAEGDASTATARATFLGTDTSDPAARGEAIYTDSKNLPTAVASILNNVQNKSGFHPATMSAEELLFRFGNYRAVIDETPFLSTEYDDTVSSSYNTKDVNVLFDQLTSIYEGVDPAYLARIKESIVNTAKSVFGSEHRTAYINLFAQSTLNMISPANPRVMLYYTQLSMRHESGKDEVSQQSYFVRRLSFFVLVDRIKEFAEELAALDRITIDDWLTDATTPERPNAQSCFEVRPYLESGSAK